MPLLRLTTQAINQLPPSSDGQVLYRDTQLKGFGVRICKRSRTYFAEGQVNGRTVRTTIGRTDLNPIEAARRKARQLLGDMANGINPNNARRQQKSELTVAEAFTNFFEAKTSLASTTRDAYRRTCDVYLQDWGRLLIKDISRQMVLARHRRISCENGAVTANNVMRHFRSVFNFSAAMQDNPPPNPVNILTQGRIWHTERRRRSLITASQLPRWWQAVTDESEDARDVLLLALFTGLRRGEVITMTWEMVDLVERSLHLPVTKNGDPLDLPLSGIIADLLDRRRNRVGQSRWVFPSRSKKGHIVETKTFTRRVSQASGVTFTMHDLRRTYISIAESLDIPAYALKRLLNHRADTDVTGGYIVISAERLREPVERISKRILELADGPQETL